MDTEKPSFHTRLQHLIQLEELDVKTFALRINRSESSITRYILGGASPRADFIFDITRVFPHWSPQYLLAAEGEPFVHQPAAPNTSTHYAATVHYWIKKKEHYRRGIEALPEEAHQALWEEVASDTKALLAEIATILQRQMKIRKD